MGPLTLQYRTSCGAYQDIESIDTWLTPRTSDGSEVRIFEFAAVSTQEIRVRFTGGNADGWSYLEEIQVYNEAVPGNLALPGNGGTAIASSSHGSGAFPVSALNDDGRSGYWNDGTRFTYADTCGIAWTAPKLINEVVLRLPVLVVPAGQERSDPLLFNTGRPVVIIKTFAPSTAG